MKRKRTSPVEVPAILLLPPPLDPTAQTEWAKAALEAALEFYGIGPDGDVISELLNALLAERFPAFRADQKLPGRPAKHFPREMIRLHLRVTALFKVSGIDPTKRGSKKRLLSIYGADLKREFPAFASQKETGSEIISSTAAGVSTRRIFSAATGCGGISPSSPPVTAD